jgi:hypothetical protein
MNHYQANAAIPAWNRIEIKPIGVLNVVLGASDASLYVLIPYPTLEAFLCAPMKIVADPEYQKAAVDFLGSSFENPTYIRCPSTLLWAFKSVPHLRLPAQTSEKKARLVELRTFESHSDRAAMKKSRCSMKAVR